LNPPKTHVGFAQNANLSCDNLTQASEGSFDLYQHVCGFIPTARQHPVSGRKLCNYLWSLQAKHLAGPQTSRLQLELDYLVCQEVADRNFSCMPTATMAKLVRSRI
jgi:hypothetical protein